MRFYLFLFLFLSFVIYAQDSDYNNEVDFATNNEKNTNNIKVRINLEDALNIASDNDKTLKKAEYDVKIAQAQKDGSFSDLFLPSLTVSGSLTLGETDNWNSSKNLTLTNWGDTLSARATLSKTLFTGFRNWNTDKANEVNLQMKKNSYYDELKNVDLNTKLAFYNTFIAQENYKVYLQSQLNYSNRMNYNYIQYRNGQISEYEYLNSRVQYENTKPQVVTLSNQYQSLKLTFIRQIGLTNVADEVELVGSILDATNITVPNMEYDDLLTIIMNNNVELSNMESNLQMLEYNKKVARSYLWPTLTGSAAVGVGTADRLRNNRDRNGQFNWEVGFTLSYN